MACSMDVLKNVWIIVIILHHYQYYHCYYCYPPTPADGKGERVRAERLWTTRNTTTVLGKLSKVAEQQQQEGATAASIRRPRLRKGEREREKDFLTQQG